jgi:hypothetical protein
VGEHRALKLLALKEVNLIDEIKAYLDDGIVESETDIIWLGNGSDENGRIFGVTYWLAIRQLVLIYVQFGKLSDSILQSTTLRSNTERLICFKDKGTYLRTKASRLMERQTLSISGSEVGMLPFVFTLTPSQ